MSDVRESVSTSAKPEWGTEELCSPLSVRLFVHYQTCECDSLKMNEPILMLVGTSGSRGRGMTRSTLRARSSKVKVI